MDSEVLIIKLFQEIDEYEDMVTYQEINDMENDIHFSVGNLSWQPEDAIIGRSLFDANDFVRALNKGIELANKGIKQVVLIGKE